MLRELSRFARDPHARQMLTLPLTLPRTLRAFFKDGPTIAGARGRLAGAVATREARFRAIARERVFARPDGPYGRLFRHAGCEEGDLARLLDTEGLEGTLSRLAVDGVYLMPDEIKGLRDVRRGSLSFRMDPRDLSGGAYEGAAFLSQSSGSTGRPFRDVASTAWLEAETLAFASFVHAHGLEGHRFAAYEPALAGVAAGIQSLLPLVRMGIPIERWFARDVPISNRLEGAFFRLTSNQIADAGTRFGPGFARPETVRANDLGRIVDWVETVRAEGGLACIRTVASNATRVARVALASGRSLEGCTFLASGEPVTEGKRRVIAEAGARTIVLWGYEPGPVYVGLGCAARAQVDEMHVLTNTLVVIDHPDPIVDVGGERIRPLLFTTLYPHATRLQINASNGDFATLSRRDCGCGLERDGLTLHVHGVGSFEKLTVEGLAYSRDDLFELLETVLPDRYGGGPGDYQLVEEEDERGRTFLTLLVDPSVGALDEGALARGLGIELAKGSRGKRFMAGVWEKEGALRVRRETPRASSRGKVLPLRLAKRGRGEA